MTLNIEDAVNDICPWSGKPVSADSLNLAIATGIMVYAATEGT